MTLVETYAPVESILAQRLTKACPARHLRRTERGYPRLASRAQRRKLYARPLTCLLPYPRTKAKVANVKMRLARHRCAGQERVHVADQGYLAPRDHAGVRLQRGMERARSEM